MTTIMEALGGANGETIMDALGGQSGETISEALGGNSGETIVEAHGGTPGETIMEAFGGNNGETIAQIIEEGGFIPNSSSITYTITFDLNGGTGIIDPIEVTAGDSINRLPGDENSPSIAASVTFPEGATEFLGWAKTASAQSPTVSAPFTPNKDTTLYAVWATGEESGGK